MTSDEQPEDAQSGSSASSRRPLFALFSANVVSSVGNNITTLAVPWFVSTPPAAPLGWALRGRLLALAECCPQSSLDRWWIDSASSEQACSPTLPQARQWQPCRPLYRAGILRFWQLLVLVFLLSSINTPGDSARFVLIPALARRAAMAA